MKKLISLLCAFAMLGGMTFVHAEGEATISMDTFYLSSDWENELEKVEDENTIIGVTISAENFPGLDGLSTSTNILGNLAFTVTYDSETLTPYTEDGELVHIEYAEVFEAKYSGSGKKIPNASTTGTIYKQGAAPVLISNTQEPGYVGNGTTTISLTGASDGFAVNGGFINLYFSAVKLNGNPEIKVTIDNVSPFDTSVEKFAILGGSTEVAGITSGSVVPPVEDKKEATITPESKANDVVDGLYTQGFKATVTPNDQIVSEVKVVLSATKAAKTAEPIVWTAPVEGFASFEFAVNVLNVPDGETVTAAWDMTAAFAE